MLEFSSGSFQPNLTPREDNCPSTFSIPSYYSLSMPSLLPVLKCWLNLVFYVSKYVCSSLPHMWVGWFLAGLSLEDFLVCTKEVLCCTYHLDFMKLSPYVRRGLYACANFVSVRVFLLLFRAGMQRLAEFIMKLWNGTHYSDVNNLHTNVNAHTL